MGEITIRPAEKHEYSLVAELIHDAFAEFIGKLHPPKHELEVS